MKTLTARVEHLEQATGVSGYGYCECGLLRIVWPDGKHAAPVRAPAICPECGRETPILRVVYGEQEGKADGDTEEE